MVKQLADEGAGRTILVVHGGMGNLDSWARVAARLRDRFRVVRVHRRQYRLDEPRPVTVAQEVEEVRAVAAGLDRPVLVGHSSGGVVALEALVADPGLYSAAVLYEPPVVLREPLGGAAMTRARQALAAGRPGTAFAIFMREIAGLRSPLVTLAAFGMNRAGRRIAGLVERQLDDNEAIDALRCRLEAYRSIGVPVLLLEGERSPRHLRDRTDALEEALPVPVRVVMAGQGHSAERSAPGRVADAIAEFVVRSDGYPQGV